MSTSIGTRPTLAPAQPVLPLRLRYLIGALVVALWMAIGFVFQLGADAYLLAGVPITILFQILANRLPLRAAWVRAMPDFRLDREGIIIGVLLAITPAVRGVRDIGAQDWSGAVYGAVGIVGAFAAAYALRRMRGTTWRQLVSCIATAGLIGIALNVLSAASAARITHRSILAQASGVSGIESFLAYVPIVFVLEEVFFRGALDTFVYRPADGEGVAWWGSAAFVSALWGAWHLPVVWDGYGLKALPSLLIFQMAVGIPLSVWWRKSGNLVVTGTTHALIDAVRNALGNPV